MNQQLYFQMQLNLFIQNQQQTQQLNRGMNMNLKVSNEAEKDISLHNLEVIKFIAIEILIETLTHARSASNDKNQSAINKFKIKIAEKITEL